MKHIFPMIGRGEEWSDVFTFNPLHFSLPRNSTNVFFFFKWLTQWDRDQVDLFSVMAFPLRCDLSPCRELFARESPDINYFLRDTSVTSVSMCSTCGWGFAPATATGRCMRRVMCCLIRSTEEQLKNMHIGNKKPAFIKLGKWTGSCDTEIFLWPVSEVIVQNGQIMRHKWLVCWASVSR